MPNLWQRVCFCDVTRDAALSRRFALCARSVSTAAMTFAGLASCRSLPPDPTRPGLSRTQEGSVRTTRSFHIVLGFLGELFRATATEPVALTLLVRRSSTRSASHVFASSVSFSSLVPSETWRR